MDIADVDLNLLVVFDALLRTRSVSARSAHTEHEPAGDELRAQSPAQDVRRSAVRPNRTRHPSDAVRGEHGAPLEAILDRIRSDLLQQPTFDPTEAARSVTFNMHDIGELVFLPRLIDRLAQIAPGVEVRTVNLPPRSWSRHCAAARWTSCSATFRS